MRRGRTYAPRGARERTNLAVVGVSAIDGTAKIGPDDNQRRGTAVNTLDTNFYVGSDAIKSDFWKVLK